MQVNGPGQREEFLLCFHGESRLMGAPLVPSPGCCQGRWLVCLGQGQSWRREYKGCQSGTPGPPSSPHHHHQAPAWSSVAASPRAAGSFSGLPHSLFSLSFSFLSFSHISRCLSPPSSLLKALPSFLQHAPNPLSLINPQCGRGPDFYHPATPGWRSQGDALFFHQCLCHCHPCLLTPWVLLPCRIRGVRGFLWKTEPHRRSQVESLTFGLW